MPDLIGQSLGRYHILEQLGEGGMATVYKAYDTRLEAEVAVKIIRTDNLAPNVLARVRKRFDREAKALAKLTHPNIVKITDYGEHEGVPYLVMPHLPGGTLKERIKQSRTPWQETVQLLAPIARALDYAHRQKIVHRDIKPSNVLITDTGAPMLSDFGVAKVLSDSEETHELTGTGMGIGTPEYMAPEQFQGKADERVDIYALGVVLYEMVTGRKPYIAETPAAVIIKQAMEPLPRPSRFTPDLPDDIEKILIKSLAKAPKDRYQSMGDFAKALERLALISEKENKKQEEKERQRRLIKEKQEQKKARVLQVKKDEKAQKPTRKRRAAKGVLAGVFGVLSLSALLIFVFSEQNRSSTLDEPSANSEELTAETASGLDESMPEAITTLSVEPTPSYAKETELISTLPAEIIDDFGVEMVLVPAGEFIQGNDLEVGFDNPTSIIELDSYYIDTYEVTNALFKVCLDEGACDYQRDSDILNNQIYSNHPVAVQLEEAKTFCEWRGAKLPSASQWEKAARGTDGRTYPWGEEISCQKANFNGCVGDTTEVGVYESGKSPYGLYDMAGNLEEWLWARSYPESISFANARGGGWSNSTEWLRTFASMRTTQYSSHGFRCVRNIEDDSVLTNDELSSTSHPENWLFFDDFEGEEKKIYIDTEGNSKGDVVQIDDSNVLSLQCDSNGSTTIGFQELLEIADTLDDYAIEFDMLMSDSSRADTVYFEVLLRSNFLPYGRFSSTQYIGEIRIGGADGFGDTIRMTYSTPGRDEAISLSGSSNINGKIPKYIRENTWYHQRLEIQGQKISWYIDNNLQLRAEDSRIQTGIPAIYCSRGQFYLDNILVESIE